LIRDSIVFHEGTRRRARSESWRLMDIAIRLRDDISRQQRRTTAMNATWMSGVYIWCCLLPRMRRTNADQSVRNGREAGEMKRSSSGLTLKPH
jgi:hypothetical protein